MSIYGDSSDDGLSGGLAAPGGGPKASANNPLKPVTDVVMAKYGALPEQQQTIVKGGTGVAVLLLFVYLVWPVTNPTFCGDNCDTGNYVAGSTAMSFTEAKTYCEGNGWQLASIHGKTEQEQAAVACAEQELGTHWGDTAKPNGCWIGLHNAASLGAVRGVFQWTDGTPVDFLNFYSGEPNQCSSADAYDPNHCGAAGEEYVELQSNWGFAWNDNGLEGSHTHDVETQAARQATMDAEGTGGTATVAARGMYPICSKTPSTQQSLSGEGVGHATTTWQLPTPSCRADPSTTQNQYAGQAMQPVRATKNMQTGKWDCPLEQDGVKPNFILLPYTSSATQADAMCRDKGYKGLASLHNLGDVNHAKELCGAFAMQHKVIKGLPHSCWIGLSDHAQEGGFAWLDGTSVEYLNWSPGEPNEWGFEESGEDYVAMRYDGTRGGAWNDANVLGDAGHAAMGANGGHTMDQITHCHGCWGPAGYYPLCEEKRPHANQNGPWVWDTLTGAQEGRFKVLPMSMPLEKAKAACEANGLKGLASIHSREEQNQASKACRQIASVDAELQHGVSEGCWIGLTDKATLVAGSGNGVFKWMDGTPVNFLNWNSGEPNECLGCGGEDGVEIDYRWGTSNGYEFGGGWNDANDFGRAGAVVDNRNTQAAHDACWGCWGAVGYFPVCQTEVPQIAEVAGLMQEWRTPDKYGTCIPQAAAGGYAAGAATPIAFHPGSNQYQCPAAQGYPPPPPPPAVCQVNQFQQYRFLIEAVRGEGSAQQATGTESELTTDHQQGTQTGAANSVQIAEFHFYSAPDKQGEIFCNYGDRCTVTNPGGDNPNRGGDVCTYNQDARQEVCVNSGLQSELAPMVVDRDPETKWLDFGMVRAGRGGNHQGSQLIFSGGDIARQNIVGYSFTTANDAPERDPSSWRFQGCSEPGTCTDAQWINLDIRTSYSAPNTRLAVTHEFATGCTGGQTSGTGTSQGLVDNSQRAFVAIPKPEAWDSARLLCKRNFGPHADLASIHSLQQQQLATETCQHLTSGETLEGGIPHSCWIGLNDVKGATTGGSRGESQFSWSDRSPVDYVAFHPGEPNNVGDNGEDVTEIDVRSGRDGRWNDNNNAGEAGNGDDMAGCYGCYGTFGNYPLCETHAPAHAASEIGHATGVEYTTCLIDTCHDYVAGAYGGQYSGGKGCTGTYQECCMPVPAQPTTEAGAGDICVFGNCIQPPPPPPGYTPPPPPYGPGNCAPNGGRRVLTENGGEELILHNNVTARATRMVHNVNGTMWVDATKVSEEDMFIMADLNKHFGDRVVTWGCTHSHALNYAPEATMEAGNCVYHEDQADYTKMY